MALLSGSLNRTVAAVCMITSQFSISSCRSIVVMPKLFSIQSPAIALMSLSLHLLGIEAFSALRLLTNNSRIFNVEQTFTLLSEYTYPSIHLELHLVKESAGQLEELLDISRY
uniref:Uncharacterized protein n=1 Tax=Glossina austeni TaxID=7395 RepID=A0A1A9VFY9_GLOAU